MLGGAVLEPLLDRLVSDHEPESLRFIGVSCFLNIEIRERQAVRHRFCSTFLGRNEVELIVDAPIIRYGVGRSVLKHQLWVGRRDGAGEHVRRRWRDEIPDRIGDGIRNWIQEWSGDGGLKEYRRTPYEPVHVNHYHPWSRQWPQRDTRLRKNCSTRNEQCENRATNRTPHASFLPGNSVIVRLARTRSTFKHRAQMLELCVTIGGSSYPFSVNRYRLANLHREFLRVITFRHAVSELPNRNDEL